MLKFLRPIEKNELRGCILSTNFGKPNNFVSSAKFSDYEPNQNLTAYKISNKNGG